MPVNKGGRVYYTIRLFSTNECCGRATHLNPVVCKDERNGWTRIKEVTEGRISIHPGEKISRYLQTLAGKCTGLEYQSPALVGGNKYLLIIHPMENLP